MLGLYSIALLHNLLFFHLKHFDHYKQEHFWKVIIPQGEKQITKVVLLYECFLSTHIDPFRVEGSKSI